MLLSRFPLTPFFFLSKTYDSRDRETSIPITHTTPVWVSGKLAPGQFPPGQLPPGELPPGQLPPRQLPPRQLPTIFNGCK